MAKLDDMVVRVTAEPEPLPLRTTAFEASEEGDKVNLMAGDSLQLTYNLRYSWKDVPKLLRGVIQRVLLVVQVDRIMRSTARPGWDMVAVRSFTIESPGDVRLVAKFVEPGQRQPERVSKPVAQAALEVEVAMARWREASYLDKTADDALMQAVAVLSQALRDAGFPPYHVPFFTGEPNVAKAHPRQPCMASIGFAGACQLSFGHAGPHVGENGTPWPAEKAPRCLHPGLGGDLCPLPAGHAGDHRYGPSPASPHRFQEPAL
jgi:hypothetical protein